MYAKLYHIIHGFKNIYYTSEALKTEGFSLNPTKDFSGRAKQKREQPAIFSQKAK